MAMRTCATCEQKLIQNEEGEWVAEYAFIPSECEDGEDHILHEPKYKIIDHDGGEGPHEIIAILRDDVTYDQAMSLMMTLGDLGIYEDLWLVEKKD